MYICKILPIIYLRPRRVAFIKSSYVFRLKRNQLSPSPSPSPSLPLSISKKKKTNPKNPPQHSKPQSYMFAQMRQALGIPKSTDILDHLHSLPQPAQDEAQTAIRAIERAAMVEQEAQPGLNELISYLEGRGVRMGLCTRNFEYVFCFVLGLFCFMCLVSVLPLFPSRGPGGGGGGGTLKPGWQVTTFDESLSRKIISTGGLVFKYSSHSQGFFDGFGRKSLN